MSKKQFLRAKLSSRASLEAPEVDAATDGLARLAKPIGNSLRGGNGVSQQIMARWQELPSRDRLALTVLMGFLLVFIGGFGGYSIHQSAHKHKTAYNDAVGEYFWLRSQAGNIDPKAGMGATKGSQNPTADVTQLITQAGINDANVAAMNDKIQLSFSHDSQAVVARVLASLQQQGWQYDKLTITQDSVTKVLQVQAVINQ